MPVLLKRPIAREILAAQVLIFLKELIHVVLHFGNITVRVSKEHFVKQTLHRFRFFLPQLNNAGAGVHSTVVNKQREFLPRRIETFGKGRKSSIRLEPFIAPNLHCLPLEQLVMHISVNQIDVLFITIDKFM